MCNTLAPSQDMRLISGYATAHDDDCGDGFGSASGICPVCAIAIGGAACVIAIGGASCHRLDDPRRVDGQSCLGLSLAPCPPYACGVEAGNGSDCGAFSAARAFVAHRAARGRGTVAVR